MTLYAFLKRKLLYIVNDWEAQSIFSIVFVMLVLNGFPIFFYEASDRIKKKIIKIYYLF